MVRATTSHQTGTASQNTSVASGGNVGSDQGRYRPLRLEFETSADIAGRRGGVHRRGIEYPAIEGYELARIIVVEYALPDRAKFIPCRGVLPA